MNPDQHPVTPQLSAQFDRAARRLRQEKLIEFCRRASLAWIAGAILLGIYLLVIPAGYQLLPVAVITALGLTATFAATIWAIRPDRESLAAIVDQRLGLADHALTALELEPAVAKDPAWQTHQVDQTVALASDADWDEKWPAQWDRRSFGRMGLVVLLGIGLGVLYFNRSAAWQLANYDPDLERQKEVLEELFQDWEEAAALTEDPELARVLEEIAPLRDKIEQGKIDEREMLLEVSQLEKKLEQMKKSLSDTSMEKMAGELADGLEDLDGMSALAAALRSKKFDKAEQEAAKLEKQLEQMSDDPKEFPFKNQAPQASQSLSKLADQAAQRRQSKLQNALASLAQGLKKNDKKSMCQGMGSLKQCLGRECKGQGACKSLGLQLAQLGGFKQCSGSGQDPGMCLSLFPKLTAQVSKKPSNKAGTATDLNRFGNPTEIASNGYQENLTGQMGEGEMEVETMSTDDGDGGAISGARAANLADYQQLSEQAIADESLPLVYRQTIRRYFESIRPDGE